VPWFVELLYCFVLWLCARKHVNSTSMQLCNSLRQGLLLACRVSRRIYCMLMMALTLRCPDSLSSLCAQKPEVHLPGDYVCDVSCHD